VHPIEHLRYLARAGYADAPELVSETASALRYLGSDPANLVLTCRRIVEKHPSCGPLWWMCAELLASLEPRETLRRCVDAVHADSTPAYLAEHLATRFPERAMVVVNGWSWELAVSLSQSFDVEVCVVDGDHGADHMVRVLERADIETHLVEAHRAAAAVGQADAVLVSGTFAAGENIWAPIGSAQLSAVAYCAGIDVIATTTVGTRLPRVFGDAILRMVDDDVRGESWHRDIEAVPLAVLTTIVGPCGVEQPDHENGIASEAPLTTELTVRSAM